MACSIPFGGRYEEAISAFNKQLEISPLDKFTYPHLASTYVKMGKWTEAAEAYRKAVAVSPDKPDLVLELGNALLKAGKTDEARQQFNRLLEQADSLTADQLNDAGRQAIDLREDALARELLARATTKEPKHAHAWNNLGLAYYHMGMLDQAESAYKKQIETNPSHEYAYTNLGRLFRRHRQYDEAIAAFKKQIEIAPLDKWAYPNLGDTYEEMGKWNEASEAFRKAVTLEPDRADLKVDLGRVLVKAGKLNEAREQFSLALASNNNGPMLNNVAYALAEGGVDLDKAQEYASSAVDQSLATLKNASLSDLAPDYLARLNTLATYLHALGWVYFQKGQLDQAEPCLVAAFDLTGHPAMAEHLARVRLRRGDAEGALRYYVYATMGLGWTGHVDKELDDYLKKKFGGPEEIKKRSAEIGKTFATQHLLKPADAPTFAWPSKEPVKDPIIVTVGVLGR